MSKVMFAVPPMENPKGYATITQNRQFQWFKDPTFLYPIMPALAMTMLARKGHSVIWLDAIAESLNQKGFAEVIMQQKPDYIIYESPAPTITRYLEIIDGFKTYLPSIKHILCGDHITRCPEDKGRADYIVRGGIWCNAVFKIITGQDWEGELPYIDRMISRWWLYAYNNGNFKFIPATYIQSAFDCWYGKCTFCSWASYYTDYRVRPVENVLTEIELLIQAGFKEIFDDSGTLPVGEWLRELCSKIIERGYNEYVSFGCNMRFGALEKDDFILLSKAGFRLILWGLESVNQKTLDLLEKGYNIKQAAQDLIRAKAAGMDNHLTVMLGYPWETFEEAKRTYDMVRYWLLNNYAFSAQATICIPYPKTPLWNYCKENNLLTTENWHEYDMTKAIMKVPYDEQQLFKWQKGIYNMAFHPKFIYHKLKCIKSIEDIRYYFRIGKKIYDRFGNFYEVGKVAQEW